jgi:hypothetical protein
MTNVRNLLNIGLFYQNVQIIEKMKIGTYVYSGNLYGKIKILRYINGLKC